MVLSCLCTDTFCSLTRSRAASPALLSTQEEVMSFLQEVPHPELAGDKPDRVLGLFNTPSHAGRRLELCVKFKFVCYCEFVDTFVQSLPLTVQIVNSRSRILTLFRIKGSVIGIKTAANVTQACFSCRLSFQFPVGTLT